MNYTLPRSNMRRRLLGAVLFVALALCAVWAAKAWAYQGPFCNHVYLHSHTQHCNSNTVSNIRRATGRSDSAYTLIYLYATGFKTLEGDCEIHGFMTGTTYEPVEVTGHGEIIDAFGGGDSYYYGYLYS